MIYHPNGDEECYKITRKRFEEIFNIKYKKSDYNIRFEDAHCGIDPYDEDVNGCIVPLVRGSAEEYIHTHNVYCQEI
ncbi:conserved hypothetical protein [Edwardsiella phage PEi26]|uniref:Uncharacterized protein n=1 Tax=Edwardsiella phage PEi26 TaxID=1608311 RepID=A0A0B6VPB7_9CAUD|nr:conserved hypothetical protein [Edwardsiella phage PEi26]